MPQRRHARDRAAARVVGLSEEGGPYLIVHYNNMLVHFSVPI